LTAEKDDGYGRQYGSIVTSFQYLHDIAMTSKARHSDIKLPGISYASIFTKQNC
jgi:hypothetical protein